MNHNFDKKIKDLIDEASLSDTGFSLDKNAVWNTIDSKKSNKIILFRKWASHAAAVIIGVLLCLPFLFHSNNKAPQTITITKTISTPKEVITDTVFIEEKSNALAVNTSSIKQQNITQHTLTTLYSKVSQPTQKETETSNIAITSKDTTRILANNTIAIITKPKVLHLLDMDNENAVPKATSKEAYALFKKINILNPSNDNAATISMLIARPIQKIIN